MEKKNKVKLIPFENIHKEWMKDAGYRKEYEDMEFEFTLIRKIIRTRGRLGLTQRGLAKKIGIAQSALARFESGRSNPTLLFIKRLVSGLGLKLTVL